MDIFTGNVGWLVFAVIVCVVMLFFDLGRTILSTVIVQFGNIFAVVIKAHGEVLKNYSPRMMVRPTLEHSKTTRDE